MLTQDNCVDWTEFGVRERLHETNYIESYGCIMAQLGKVIDSGQHSTINKLMRNLSIFLTCELIVTKDTEMNVLEFRKIMQ